MSEQTAAPGYNPSSEDDRTLEASARSLSEFVIRAALLPVSLLLTKPSRLAEAAATGNFRPLPSPFLLALTAGVIVSGVTSNLDKLNIEAVAAHAVAAQSESALSSEFLKGVMGFYREMDGIKAILYAVPYVFLLWILAGFISFAMMKGIKHAEPLFASVSLCLSALVELTVLAIVVVVTFDLGEGAAAFISLFVGFFVYTLILAWKLIRLMFLLKKGEKFRWLGTALAAIPTLLIVVIFGLFAAGFSSILLIQQQGFRNMVAQSSAAAKPKPESALSAPESAPPAAN